MTQTARRGVIIGGADIQNYERLRAQLEPDDYCIYCDSGLKHREALGVQPSLIVGDFDSHENPHADVETIVLPTVKDDTDTVYAVKEGLRRGFSDFLLLGVARRTAGPHPGQRLHSLLPGPTGKAGPHSGRFLGDGAGLRPAGLHSGPLQLLLPLKSLRLRQKA